MPELVEECTGVGALGSRGGMAHPVRYRLTRYQQTMGNGLPVPGLHRIEGQVEFDALPVPPDLVGTSVVLQLDDGRALGVILADDAGRIVHEERHPVGCACC